MAQFEFDATQHTPSGQKKVHRTEGKKMPWQVEIEPESEPEAPTGDIYIMLGGKPFIASPITFTDVDDTPSVAAPEPVYAPTTYNPVPVQAKVAVEPVRIEDIALITTGYTKGDVEAARIAWKDAVAAKKAALDAANELVRVTHDEFARIRILVEGK